MSINSLGPETSDADFAVALVTGAGHAAWRHQQRIMAGAEDLDITVKTNPTDVVTAADTEAEARIVALLGEHRPHDAVVGEEGAFSEGTSGRTWVIDPIDGTYNFVRGSDRWCSAVALVENGEPTLGAICRPRTATFWVGGPGIGTRENRTALPPLVDRPLSESSLLTYLHPPFHETRVGETWRRLVARVATLRMSGSGSLDATDVITGRADLIVQHSVPIWDSTPGQALIRGVGGSAARVSGSGVEWYLAGVPSAVRQAAELLGA